SDISFNIYRATGGGSPVKRNINPISATTDFNDTGVNIALANSYFVRPVIGGVEQAASETFTVPANAPVEQYLNIPLQIPPGGTTPDNLAYSYTANDASVGDVDGDGQYEIILKWDPADSHDSSQD